jgi:hypothetical protein
VADTANPVPKSSDEILDTNLPNPSGSRLVLQEGETLKFWMEANGNDNLDGLFILTDRRWAFQTETDYWERDLAIVNHINVDYDWRTVQPQVEGRWMHLMVISTIGIKGEDKFSYGLIPDNEQLTNNLAKAMIALRDRRKTFSSASQPATTKEIIIKEIVKIPCRYCGTLNLITDSTCGKCGAPVR